MSPQSREDDGFGEVVVAAGRQAFFAVADHGMGGQGHDRPLPAVLAEPPRGFVAVHSRHLDVHENQVVGPPFGLRLLGHVAGRLAVLGHFDFEVHLPQQLDETMRWMSGVVFRQQQPAAQRRLRSARATVPACGSSGLRALAAWARLQRAGVDRQGERASLAQFAGDFDVAAQGLGQALGDGQPQARAAVAAASPSRPPA